MRSFKLDFMKTNVKAAGEPMVWFTSMGLSIGLLMVAFLLGLIAINGFEVFWPDRVAVFKLKQAKTETQTLAGRIIQEERKTSGEKEETELQVFLGNKDIYGLAFRYLDRAAIIEEQYPHNVMVMERLEYGEAIGFAKELQIKDAKLITAGEPQFRQTLESVVEDANQRWSEIKRIEKKEIGDINQKMERLQVQEKVLQRKGDGAAVQAELQRIHARRSALQSEYEALAKEAASLRQRQEESFLTYTLATGEEKQLPTGQIIHFYYPNELGFYSRALLAVERFWNFLSDEPREANTEGGIFPAIFGTFVMTLLLSIAVTPFGVLAAIYLREYAKQGLFVRSVRIAVNNLAGVPSIVFGVFGLGFFVYTVGGSIDRLFFSEYLPTPTFGTGGILWASLTLALMTVPVVIVATEEALAAVPRGVREGSLACGASKWQTIQRIVLPASATGILTGLILAMARGAGEVAPLMLVGVVKLAPSLPLDTTYPFLHLDQKFMHLGFHIYDLGFQSPDSEAAKPMVFATTFLLILLVVLLNLGAIVIRERLRRKYATSAF